MHTLHFYPHCSVLLNGGCHECVWKLTHMLCHLPTHTCVCGHQAISQFLQKKQDFLIFATHTYACMHWMYHITFKCNSPTASAERPVHPKFSDVPNTLMCAGSTYQHQAQQSPDLSQHTCVCAHSQAQLTISGNWSTCSQYMTMKQTDVH